MKNFRVVPACVIVSSVFFFTLSPVVYAQATSHRHQIWGSVRTEEKNTVDIFDKDVTILVREFHNRKMGRVVGFSTVRHGHYAVDMGDVPAGKYVVQVDTGNGFYMGGLRVVNYPGHDGNVMQNWTLYADQSAVPASE